MHTQTVTDTCIHAFMKTDQTIADRNRGRKRRKEKGDIESVDDSSIGAILVPF